MDDVDQIQDMIKSELSQDEASNIRDKIDKAELSVDERESLLEAVFVAEHTTFAL